MARICPQCSQIHFETSTDKMPTRCTKCDADLNGFGASAIPMSSAEAGQSRTPAPQTGKIQSLVGVLLLAACGASTWFGMKLSNESVEATALVIKYNKSIVAPKGTNRADNIAFFTHNGARVYTYPGVRAEGDSFKVYFNPATPESASEQKPFLLFIAAGFLGLVGGVMTLMGLLRYFITRAQYRDFNRTIRMTQG